MGRSRIHLRAQSIHNSRGFNFFKSRKCGQIKTCYIIVYYICISYTIVIHNSAEAEIKVSFGFMPVLHESKKKNPYDGKSSLGKNNENWHISTVVKRVCSALQHLPGLPSSGLFLCSALMLAYTLSITLAAICLSH